MAGQLATASFDHQHPQAPDNRMQRPNLNARNEISPWIRWEGMQVYVVQEQKTYQLVGGTGNEHWQEIAAGGGASNFVGQFPTFDDLPGSGSPGDYAYVGTGDDFVQYNWDQIAGEWRLNSAETKVSDEDFFLGRVPSDPDRVMFSMRRNSIIYSTGGSQSISPDRMANYIFTGENVTLENVNYDTEGNEEFHITNRTGSNLTILGTGNFASGLTIPAGHMASFKSSNDGWVQSFVNEEATFSDTLDSVNAKISRGPDGKEVLSGVIDDIIKVPLSFKEIDYTPENVDGRIFRSFGGKIFGDADFLENRVFNVLKFGADDRGNEFSDVALDRIRLLYRDGDKIVFPQGNYTFQNEQRFLKDIEIDFGGSKVTFNSQNGFIFESTEKSTHTVTSDYSRGENFLQLNNTSSIEAGDLINVISSELYNHSRSYYYKGGNAKVIRVTGNVVYFDICFPFDMSGASIEVKIYKGIQVQISNLELDSSQPLENTMYGIWLIHAKNTRIYNLKTKNFRYNISLRRCVDGVLDTVVTGHAMSETSGIGYGVEVGSCSNIELMNVATNSGQHGVTTGWREVNYNISFVNCNLKAETTSRGFGSHSNLYSSSFKDCILHGFWMCGNVVVDNCDVTDGGNPDSYYILDVAEDPSLANYIFRNTRLSRPVRVMDGGPQIDTLLTRFVGNISFISCENLHLQLYLNNIRPEKTGDVGNVEISQCMDFLITSYDDIGSLIIKDSTAAVILSPGVNQISGHIKNLVLDRVYLYRRPISLLATSVGRLTLIALGWREEIEASGGGLNLGGIKYLTITDTDMSNVERGINSYGGVENVSINNSKIKFRLTSVYNQYISQTESFTAVGFTNVDTGILADIQTDEVGGKKIKTITERGWYRIGDRIFQPVRTVRSSAQINTTFQPVDSDRFVRFTAVNPGSATIPPDEFEADDELQGEIEGGAKTFVAGAGVTLRYPEGGTNVAPTNSRFFIKFKSPNDAQLTIVPSTVPENTYDTFIPAINGSTSNPTVSYTDQFGDYALIDKLCHFEIRLNWQSMSGGTGNIRIPLPIPRLRNTANGGPAIAVLTGLSTSPPIYACYSGFNNIGFRNAAGNEISVSDLESEGVIALTGTYIIGE